MSLTIILLVYAVTGLSTWRAQFRRMWRHEGDVMTREDHWDIAAVAVGATLLCLVWPLTIFTFILPQDASVTARRLGGETREEKRERKQQELAAMEREVFDE